MQVTPYLSFEGRCEEALEFYRSALGAEVVDVSRYKDFPAAMEGCGDRLPPGSEAKVMHSSLKIGETLLMATDGLCSGKPKFEGISLSVKADDAAEADRLFNALADGGQVQMPLGETFFSPRFGMVADRFGVSWMVIVLPEGPC